MSQTALKIDSAVKEFLEEDAKFEGGNKSAGTRARKALMDLKKLADTRRKEIQAVKNES
jgi:hypothetical protein